MNYSTLIAKGANIVADILRLNESERELYLPHIQEDLDDFIFNGKTPKDLVEHCKEKVGSAGMNKIKECFIQTKKIWKNPKLYQLKETQGKRVPKGSKLNG